MVTVTLSSSFPNPSLRSSHLSFRPSLHFAEAIKTNFLPLSHHSDIPSCKIQNPVFPQIRSVPSQVDPKIVDPTVSRPDFLYRKSRPVCFKCGCNGHLAKTCRFAVHCYACGVLGHKRRDCFSLQRRVTKPFASLGAACEPVDAFWPSHLTADTEDRSDPMFLDSDVMGALNGPCAEIQSMKLESSKSDFQTEEKDGSSLEATISVISDDGKYSVLDVAGNVLNLADVDVEESLPALSRKPCAIAEGLIEANGDIEIVETRDASFSSTLPNQAAIELELSYQHPVNLSNITIIDNLPHTAGVPLNKEGSEIFFFSDPLKFYLYCAIQGFRIVARSRLHVTIPYIGPSPSARKSAKRASKVILSATRRSPRLLKIN